MAKAKVFSLDTYKKKSKLNASEYPIRIDAETVVILKNPLRVDFEKRARLFELADSLSSMSKAEGEEKTNLSVEDLQRYTELAIEIIELVGDENVHRLIAGIDGDVEVLFAVFTDYFEAVGMGEASPSEG